MDTPSVPVKKAELACDACRLLKVRCIRDDTSSQVCKKCSRSGIQCTWKDRQLRTRKPVLSSGERITALEARIDQLLTVIEAKGLSSPHTQENSINQDEQSNATPISQQGPEENSFLDDLANCFQLSVDKAEVYLRHFRNMALYFPFIIIPDSTNIHALSRESPMLLLAVLTVSTTQDAKLQTGLESMLRRDLVEKTMLHGEKNSDLLAALVVYLGWSQFFLLPRRDSLQQFFNLAISLCDDLGLSLRPEEAENRWMRLHVDHNGCSIGDGQRLYLGTYFLLSW
jgi:hypothetical protein